MYVNRKLTCVKQTGPKSFGERYTHRSWPCSFVPCKCSVARFPLLLPASEILGHFAVTMWSRRSLVYFSSAAEDWALKLVRSVTAANIVTNFNATLRVLFVGSSIWTVLNTRTIHFYSTNNNGFITRLSIYGYSCPSLDCIAYCVIQHSAFHSHTIHWWNVQAGTDIMPTSHRTWRQQKNGLFFIFTFLLHRWFNAPLARGPETPSWVPS